MNTDLGRNSVTLVSYLHYQLSIERFQGVVNSAALSHDDAIWVSFFINERGSGEGNPLRVVEKVAGPSVCDLEEPHHGAGSTNHPGR